MNRTITKLLIFTLLVVGTFAHAQVVRSFGLRYSANTNGDIMVIGNTVQTCEDCDRNNQGLNNNEQNMVFVDQDSTGSTFNSSSATLTLPSGATVLWAGLYWGGARDGSEDPPNESQRNRVRFRYGSGSYSTIFSSQLDEGITHPQNPYSAFANVTTQVQTNGNGTYWVANVQSATGTVEGGTFGAWSLVVVYTDPAAPLRNLTVFDGYLNQAASASPTTINVSGFLTPLVGAVNARVGFIVQEGDGGITGDYLTLNSTNLFDAVRPSTNFFNSSITSLGTHFAAKNPNYLNQMAYDMGRTTANGILANGATSASLTYGTNGDGYYPVLLSFAVDLYAPNLKPNFSKTITDLNGGGVAPGDVLEFTISFTNSGGDGAANVILNDPIPAFTSYVPGSLRVDTNASGAPTGTFTDASGDDIANFDALNNRVLFRLGSGANASSGGLVPPNQGAIVRFRVQVASNAGGQTINNTAVVNYNAQTLGTALTDSASGSASTSVSGLVVSGVVYQDQQPNSLREPSENWSSGTTVYINLVQSGSVVQSQTVNAGSGAFSFSGVAAGNYTLVLSNSPTNPNPAPPSGWLAVEPSPASRNLSVTTLSLLNQDFGLFNGARVVGRVFFDDGFGAGATANDALQNGQEGGVAGVNVTASQSSNNQSTVTDSSGNFVLWLPAAQFSGAVTLTQDRTPASGRNVAGAAVYLASTFSDLLARQHSINVVAGNVYPDRNFAVVRFSNFFPPQSGQASSPSTFTYRHFYRPGTLGNVTITASGAAWVYQMRRDVNCDGDFADAGEGFAPFPFSFAVNNTWPRDDNGWLESCLLELQGVVPPGVPPATVDQVALQAILTWLGSAIQDPQLLIDVTVVNSGRFEFDKVVRNLTQSTPFGNRIEARPGDVLEYCLRYRNPTAAPVTNVVITDNVPFFTVLQAGQLRLNGNPLTDAADADAGEIVGGLLTVRAGNLGAAQSGEVCYRAQVR